MPGFSPRAERYALIAAFALYAIAQADAILHHGSYGQDFRLHQGELIAAAKNPFGYLWRSADLAFNINTPVYALFGGLVFNLTQGIHYLEVIAFLQVALNIGAFCLLYRIVTQLIRSPILRVACMVFILFIPVLRITSTVLSADGFAIPTFIFVLYALTRLDLTKPYKQHIGACDLVALLLSLAVITKYTAVSLIAASVVLAGAFMRSGMLDRRRGLATMAVLGLIPACFACLEMAAWHRSPRTDFEISPVWINPLTSPYMNLRSLLLPRPDDVHILDAPPYDDPGLLIPNRHSYPALLHLAVFTDVLNIFQYDPTDAYFGARSAGNQARMRLAVRTGLLFSLCAVIGVPVMAFRAFSAAWTGRLASRRVLFITALMSGAWFLNIVLFMPFVTGVYEHGAWLPRLIAPALCGFIVLTFAFLDESRVMRGERWRWACLVAVVLQSCVHFSFLWPWGNF